MKDRANFSICYSGKALEDGTMDVNELAPALFAIGKIVNEANKIINDKQEKIQINVQAFRKGSFIIDIEVAKSILDQIVLFNNNHTDMLAVLQTLGLIQGFTDINLLEVFKYIKGRKIKTATRIDKETVQMNFVDNSQSVTMNYNVYNIFTNTIVQESIGNIVKPLNQEGIDTFCSYMENENKENGTKITKAEVQYYQPISYEEQEDELITESVFSGAYHIVTANFEGGYKWRLANDSGMIQASMVDQEFIDKLDNNEISLAKEDILLLEIKATQWRTSNEKIRTQYEIIKVKKHIEANKQIGIKFEGLENIE